MKISSYYSLDKIFVLSLIRNKNIVQEKFNTMFSKDDKQKRLTFYFTEGIKNNNNPVNNGNYDASLREIITHTSIDAISKNIFLNHMSILKLAKEKKYQNIMILEDDAIWNNEQANKMIPIVNKYVEKNKFNFDICYLGYINHPYIFSFPDMFNFNFVKPYSPLTAHGYIITQSGIDKILYYQNLLYPNFNVHLDKFYSTSKNLRKIATFPQYIFQDKDPALYIKGMDTLGLKIPFKTMCKINEFLSLFICFLIFYVFIVSSRSIFRKLLSRKK